ncbi:MAG: Asp-tRNA(Asn)/Glu-tRNA(Gln) amidotransferase subunit GatB [Bdellovibrionota bacterium]|nr:Asp-tRNA(Asn)/Glu-tRNA(Gln) amidotransferase subunit GatB [Bdellovibrionota bacterium]
MSSSRYETVIGIEVHVQLNTKTKLFCSCSTEFSSSDNHNICPVCTGMPGALPVMNKKVIELASKTGLALNCKINQRSQFSRKNYFYPDSPKAYQISQYDLPICENGYLDVRLSEGAVKRIGVTRAHIEEDAGKSSHHGNYSLINFNRTCVPLLEIVSEPDMRSPSEAAEYVRALRSVVQYLGVCDGNLEEGSMRADCNVSIRPFGQKEFGTKVELKNINSFRFIEKAIAYEVSRQADLYDNGDQDQIVQETRLYDADKNKTYSMRTKEDAHDYRYFPEPDLMNLMVSDELLKELQSRLIELPFAKAERFKESFGLSEQDALLLVQQREMAEYFEEVATKSKEPKLSANWISTELMRVLKESKQDIKDFSVSAGDLAELLVLLSTKKINAKIAKTVFEEMITSSKTAGTIVEAKGLVQDDDPNSIAKFIDQVIESNPEQVEQYRSGKEKVFNFFLGQTMRLSKGKANPDLVSELLKEKLSK